MKQCACDLCLRAEGVHKQVDSALVDSAGGDTPFSDPGDNIGSGLAYNYSGLVGERTDKALSAIFNRCFGRSGINRHGD